MEGVKLDILAPKEEQLKILVPYLEDIAKSKKEKPLPITMRTRTLIGRYLWNWLDLYTKEGLKPKGALIYYRNLIKEIETE